MTPLQHLLNPNTIISDLPVKGELVSEMDSGIIDIEIQVPNAFYRFYTEYSYNGKTNTDSFYNTRLWSLDIDGETEIKLTDEQEKQLIKRIF